MNKTLKIIVIFLAFDVVAVGLYFGIKALTAGGGKSPIDDYEWKVMDAGYQPQDYVEQFIKEDAAQKNIFPVYIRNYGRNKAVLKRFKGKNFARASEAVLNMIFPGLDDWTLIDLKYKNEKNREVARAILYVSIKGQWRVGDGGTLVR